MHGAGKEGLAKREEERKASGRVVLHLISRQSHKTEVYQHSYQGGTDGRGDSRIKQILETQTYLQNMTKSDPRVLAGIYCPETKSGSEGSSGINESSLETPKQHQFGGSLIHTQNMEIKSLATLS